MVRVRSMVYCQFSIVIVLSCFCAHPEFFADLCKLCSELVSLLERQRDSVTEVFQLVVLKFGTVYHLCSGLRT